MGPTSQKEWILHFGGTWPPTSRCAFSLEFVLGKLPEPLRSKVGAYLFETLDLIPTPLGYLLHFGVSVNKGVLTNPAPVVRVLH